MVVDEALMRPAEVDRLAGDYGKAERELGWTPTTGFEELIRLMVDADVELLGARPYGDRPAGARGGLWGAAALEAPAGEAPSPRRRAAGAGS